MAFPLGAIAYSAAGTVEDDFDFQLRLPRFVRSRKAAASPALNGAASLSSLQRRSTSSSKKSDPSTTPSKRWRPGKKHQKSLSAKALAANKRARADSNPASPPPVPIADDDDDDISPNYSLVSDSRGHVFELSVTSPRGLSTTRPKHIPILVPGYGPLASEHSSEPRSGSFSTFLSSGSDDSPSISDFPTTPTYHPPPPTNRDTLIGPVKPRHVEIKIPSWAQPVLKQPATPPRLSLSRSIFLDPFTEPDVAALSFPDMSQPTPELSRSNTVESIASPGPPLYANQNHSGSQTGLASASSSQSSLVGMRAEYESASETDSAHEDGTDGRHTPSQMPGLGSGNGLTMGQSTPGGGNIANLSGLVCNVHRTSGKEPHPLVGATTTILADKLYVFAGRRLSRTKPQLTASLYELDLIHRHWTKLDVKGDVPAARYFHSVCALGDTKLVCYGGMSPAPLPADAAPETQPEVVVMSDIHIYDVPSKTWTKINTPDSPQGRYAHCATMLPSSAVFGNANAPTSALHHNPSGSNPNQGSLGVEIDGTGGAEMVVVGGQDSANHYIEQISIFNLRSLKWTGTTGMGRSCGAYRSVVTPLTGMSASEIGSGPHTDHDDDEPETIGSGAPMLIYSNYNFLDVKLELQVRLPDGTLTEKPMQSGVSPPGLRFPNGGVIHNHFVVSGTFLTSSKQEYALWTLDLRTLTWSRIDAGGSIFSQGSWNRGVLWARRNCFVILGNRKRSLVDDYNNRRINFSNICLVELEAFGLYDNPRQTEPTATFVSASGNSSQAPHDVLSSGRKLSPAAEELGAMSLSVRELADMDFLAIDGTRIPVNSRFIARRWGHHFVTSLRESMSAAVDTDTATLRPSVGSHPSRNSSLTITPSVTSGTTTLTNNSNSSTSTLDIPDTRSAPPPVRPRLFYLPHTASTLHALLHYLYTSTLPSPPSPLATVQTYCSLLQLARPYKIDGLLEAVVQRLHESLDGRNAAAIFNAAAMGAGSGDGVQFTTTTARESTIPLRTASLAALNGGGGLQHVDLKHDGEGEEAGTAWTGTLSAVVGLQKRGLRGLMEGRRIRERGSRDAQSTQPQSTMVGLGIA